MWSIREGALSPLIESDLHEPFNAPRQALPATFWQTGHIDVIRSSTILLKASMSGSRILPVHVASPYALDIDERIHWRIAEEILAEGLDVVRPRASRGAVMAGIRLLVFDFDGVFTDNQVYVGEDGGEWVNCNRGDGLGIARLRMHGIEAAVLSTETNPVVAARCSKLNLPVKQGLANKAAALRELVHDKGLSLDVVAYVGNDLNDIECLEMARFSLAPADAHPAIRGMADLVLQSSGGHGAVREVCELAITSRNQERSSYAPSLHR